MTDLEKTMIEVRAGMRQLFLDACKKSNRDPKDIPLDWVEGYTRAWYRVDERLSK